MITIIFILLLEVDSVDEDPLKALVFWEPIAAFSPISLECAIQINKYMYSYVHDIAMI